MKLMQSMDIKRIVRADHQDMSRNNTAVVYFSYDIVIDPDSHDLLAGTNF